MCVNSSCFCWPSISRLALGSFENHEEGVVQGSPFLVSEPFGKSTRQVYEEIVHVCFE